MPEDQSDALLDDYDPSLGLVARGVMQGADDHDPDSCEASCCAGPDPLACPPDGGCSGCGNWPKYCVCRPLNPTGLPSD